MSNNLNLMSSNPRNRYQTRRHSAKQPNRQSFASVIPKGHKRTISIDNTQPIEKLNIHEVSFDNIQKLGPSSALNATSKN